MTLLRSTLVLLALVAAPVWSADVAPPLFLANYPLLRNIDCRSLDVSLAMNEAGLAFCFAVPSTARGPTIAELLAGQYNGTASAPVVWVRMEMETNVISTTPMLGLKSNTQYVLYCVAQDRVPNVQLLKTSQTFATPADIAPPTWSSGFPRITRTSLTSVSVDAAMNEDGQLYWAILPAGSTSPSTTQLRAGTLPGQLAGGQLAAPYKNEAVHVNFDSLLSNQNYDFYIVGRDGDGLQQAVPAKFGFVTDPAPDFDSGYPAFSYYAETSVYMQVRLNEAGTLHFCVQRPASLPPTAAQVKAGACNSMVLSQHMAVSSTGASFGISLMGLLAATTYTVYSAPEDTKGNVAYTVSEARFTTAGADTSFDGFASGYPSVSLVTANFVTLSVKILEPGAFYACVTTSNTVPTVADVMNGAAPTAVSCVAASAGVTAKFVSIVGLAPNTAYHLRYAGADQAGNKQAIVSTLDFTTSADNLAPEFLDGFPIARSITDISFQLAVSLTEPGTVYYAALRQVNVPTTSDLVGRRVVDAVASGSVSVAATGSVYNATVTGLPSNTDLVIYVLAVDSRGNVQQTPTQLLVKTLVNLTPTPEFAVGFPRATGLSDESSVFEVKLNTAGRIFYTVLDSTVPSPTSDIVKAGNVGMSGSAVEAAMLPIVSVYVGGLSPATQYVAYFVSEDNFGHLRAAPTNLAFTTLAVDNVPPVFINGFPVATAHDTRVSVQLQLNEPATVYAIVLPAGTAAPSVADVQAQASGVAKAVGAVTAGATTVTMSLSGLAVTTPYTVYLVMQDRRHNMVTVVTAVDFTTIADVSPPAFVTGYPSVGAITDKGASLSIMADEAGSASYCLVPSGVTPTVAQVQTGTCGSQVASGATTYNRNSAITVQATNPFIVENTPYAFALILQDLQGNLQPAVTMVPFTTAMDTQIPTSTTTSTAPDASVAVDAALIGVSVTVSEPCMLYWMILPVGTDSVTASSVINGKLGSSDVSASGTLDVTATPLTRTFNVAASKLIAASGFQVYSVAVDVSAAHNVESPASSSHLQYSVVGTGGSSTGGSTAGQQTGGNGNQVPVVGGGGGDMNVILTTVGVIAGLLVLLAILILVRIRRRNSQRREVYKTVEGVDDAGSERGRKNSAWMDAGYDDRSRRSSYNSEDDRPRSQESSGSHSVPVEDDVELMQSHPHYTRSSAPMTMAMLQSSHSQSGPEMLDLEAVLQEAENVSKRVMSRPLEELAGSRTFDVIEEMPGSVREKDPQSIDEDEDDMKAAVTPIITRSAAPVPRRLNSSNGMVSDDDGELDLEPVLSLADKITGVIGSPR